MLERVEWVRVYDGARNGTIHRSATCDLRATGATHSLNRDISQHLCCKFVVSWRGLRVADKIRHTAATATREWQNK